MTIELQNFENNFLINILPGTPNFTHLATISCALASTSTFLNFVIILQGDSQCLEQADKTTAISSLSCKSPIIKKYAKLYNVQVKEQNKKKVSIYLFGSV